MRMKGTVVNKELQTVVDWVDYYRGEFHLPVAERGGYVCFHCCRPWSPPRWPRLRSEARLSAR